MRLIVVLYLIACGPTAIPVTEKVTVPTNMQDAGIEPPPTAPAKPGDKPKTVAAGPGTWKAGPGDFPLPGDSDDGTEMINNRVYQIPRPRDAVHEELVKHITSLGYTIHSDKLFMGGYRMEVTNKEGRKYSVSVTENEEDVSTIMQVTPN